jgi:hypothetical protein
VQLIWGTALVLVGVAVFFRIPQVMPQLAQMGQSDTTLWVIRVCFYLMGVLLIGGGIGKFIRHFYPGNPTHQLRPTGEAEKESDR